jgi:FkbM family methyltransferase
MLLDLEKLIEKYDMDIRGCFHIGAYNGGEISIYKKLGIEPVFFFEPQPDAFKMLMDKIGDKFCEGYWAKNFALGSFHGKATMYVASNGQSSSLLKPQLHSIQYPDIKFNKQIEVDVCMLDEEYESWSDFNFINIDVEGYELEVFKGATQTLKRIDYIMSEVSKVYLRKDQVLVNELDEFLSDFERVETNWAGGTWGDALYIRK